jgi:hypothetical protein
LAFPWLPLFPLLPLQGLPLPFAHGSPGGIDFSLAAEPFARLPWSETFAAVVRTIAPCSTRAALAGAAVLPEVTISAARAFEVEADANWTDVTRVATSNVPWFTTIS